MTGSTLADSHASQVLRAVTEKRGIDAVAPHIERSCSRCLQEFGIRPHAPRDTWVARERRLITWYRGFRTRSSR